jgi:hypothetical protein
MPHHRTHELFTLLARSRIMAIRGFSVQLSGDVVHITRAESLVGSWRSEGEKFVFLAGCQPGTRSVAGNVNEAVHLTMTALNDYCE